MPIERAMWATIKHEGETVATITPNADGSARVEVDGRLMKGGGIGEFTIPDIRAFSRELGALVQAMGRLGRKDRAPRKRKGAAQEPALPLGNGPA